MRSKVIARTLVTTIAAFTVGAGGLPAAGAAAAAPAGGPVTIGESVAPLAVNNLGLSVPEAKTLQRWLRSWGYSGSIDGQLGTNSWKAMQRWLKAQWGYTGAIDGIAGPNTIKALQRRLRDGGSGYYGPIDGIAGPLTRAAFGRFVERLYT